MHKVLIPVTAVIAVTLTGCSGMRDIGDAIPNTLESWSLMYRPNVQQGNVIDQEMMDKLEIGMDKRQVRYALGTPMLVDVFHQDRWDYVYTFGRGSKPKEIKRSSLVFEDGRLTRIEGELQPRPADQRPEPQKELLVTVPDYERQDLPLFERSLRAIGLKKEAP